MFRFENGMNVARTKLEENERVDEARRWFRLDIDLNYPLPGQDMSSEPYEMPSLTLAESQNLPVEANSQIHKQPAADEVIDNEVSLISPTLFAEARKKPRREDDTDEENTQIAAPAAEQPPPAPVFRCPICMGNLQVPTSTKCGHIFCKDCIEAAITYRKRCPTCRKRFRGKATFRVYLPTFNL